MRKKLFRPLLNCSAEEKIDFLTQNIIGLHKQSYFDYTASGLSFKAIEDRMHDVLETYANTHSKEASMAATTNDYYIEAKQNLKNSLEISDDFAIIPVGCGSTAAIKRFQEILGLYIPPATKKRYNLCDFDKSKLPLVIVGPYEHHSNEVSYREAICESIRIPLNSDGLVDLIELKNILEKNKRREIIGSFCIASNVTGIITPYKEISELLRSYNALVCFDSAASSPYMNVDCNLYDALFMSPHKLLGGPGSCGLLAIRKTLIDDTIAPTFAGGGTVDYVSRTTQNYSNDKETREDAGTPAILQLIRASLAYQLRNEIGFEFIKDKKNILLKYLIKELKTIPDCKIYGNITKENIGIVSFNIGNNDPYKLCENLSKKFSMQTRAGCSCAGPYGHDLLGMQDQISLSNKPGWLRISIHFTQTKKQIKNLVEAIKNSIL